MTLDPLNLASDTPWLAVHAWAGREHLVARHLLARGYEVFLPSYREWRRWSDRRRAVDRALFTGYVFCRSAAEVVAKIVSTPGVLGVVGDGRGPLPVAPEEIETLQRATAAGLEAQPWECLQAGEPVHVIDGPLRGAQGFFVKAKNQHRLIISVSLLKRSVAVEIDEAWVQESVRSARSGSGYTFQVFDGAASVPTMSAPVSSALSVRSDAKSRPTRGADGASWRV